MSRAFVKEDVEVAERSTRSRSSSGLPPGTLNYLTARGARWMRQKIAAFGEGGDEVSALEWEARLAAATVIAPPEKSSAAVTFGATVTLQAADGSVRRRRIVGIDELDFEPNAVSWISSEGRALLGAECGQQVVLEGGPTRWRIIKIEHDSAQDSEP